MTGFLPAGFPGVGSCFRCLPPPPKDIPFSFLIRWVSIRPGHFVCASFFEGGRNIELKESQQIGQNQRKS